MKAKGKNLEAVSITYVGFNIASIALIGQVFNLASNTELFFLVCIFFMGIVPFYTKAKLLSFMYMIFSTMYFLWVEPNILRVIFNLGSNSIFYYGEIAVLISIMIYSIIPFCYLKFVLTKEVSDSNIIKLDEKVRKKY